MQLEQVLNFGVAPNDGNISGKEANAIVAFLKNIEELGVRDMAIRVAQGSPSNGVMVKLADIEGVIPADYRLEYYVWLGGLKSANYVEDGNDETDPCYHNVRAIQRSLTQYPKMSNSLMFYINQYNSGLYLITTKFAAAATDKALVEAWHKAHGTTEPVDDPRPADPVSDPVKDNPAMPDAEGFLGAKTFFPGVFNVEPGDDTPVGTIRVAPNGKRYKRLEATWAEVQ